MRTELDSTSFIIIGVVALVYVLLTVLYNQRLKTCSSDQTMTKEYINATTGAVVAVPVIMMLLKFLDGNDLGVMLMFYGILGLVASLVAWNLNKKCTTTGAVKTWTNINMGLFIAAFASGVYLFQFKSDLY